MVLRDRRPVGLGPLLLLLAASLLVCPTARSDVPGSFEVQGEPLTSVIAQVARAMGMRVRISPDLPETLVTFFLRHTTPQQALQLLGETYGFRVARAEDNLLVIGPIGKTQGATGSGQDEPSSPGAGGPETGSGEWGSEVIASSPPPAWLDSSSPALPTPEAAAQIFGSEDDHQQRMFDAASFDLAAMQAAAAAAAPPPGPPFPQMPLMVPPVMPQVTYFTPGPEFFLAPRRTLLQAYGYGRDYYGAPGLGPGFIGPLEEHSRPLLTPGFAPFTVLPPSWPMFPW